MIGKIFFTAFLAVFAQANVEPMPGAIAASLNVTSLNNIMQLAAPLAANKALNGHTFEINYNKKGFAGIYNVDIKDISFITVDGFSIRDVSFKEGTDTLMVSVGGINVNATCNASVSGLWVVKAALESFTVENITMQLELSTTSDDQVHWQLAETTRISIKDLTLKMDSKFWQTMVDKNMNLIRMGIYKGLQKLVTILADKAKAFNAKLASDKPYTYLDTPFVQNLLLNTTMTKAPELSREKNQINIHMNGLYVFDVDEPVEEPDANTDWQIIYNEGKQRN